MNSTTEQTKVIEYGTEFNGTGSKDKRDECFENVEHIPFGYQTKGKWYNYTAYKNHQDFINMFNKTKEENKMYYEHHYGKDVEFYDIDQKHAKHTEEEYLEEFIKVREEWGNLFYKEQTKFLRENMLVIRTPDDESEENKGKVSLHIIIRNGYYFETVEDMNIYMTSFKKWVIDNDKLITDLNIDLSVYSTSHLFRTLGSHKYGQPKRVAVRYDDFNKLTSTADDLLFYFSYLLGNEKPVKILKTIKGKYINKRPTEIIKTDDEIIKTDDEIIKTDNDKYDNIDNDKIEPLLNLLSDDHADDEVKWTAVMYSLYNHFKGSDEGLKHWINFSKRSEKFDEEVCMKKWNRIKDDTSNPRRIGSIIRDVKKSNLAEYNKLFNIIKKTKDHDWVEKLLTLTEQTDLYCADKFKELNKNEMFYTNSYEWVLYNKTTRFWTFNNKKIQLTSPITEFFTYHVKSYYDNFLNNFNKDDEKDLIKKKMLEKLINKVGQSKFTKGIIDHLISKLSVDDEYIQQFDNKPNLIAFKNGVVFDLLTGTTRDITKEDMIFTHTGYDFPKRNEEYIKKTLDIIKTMVPRGDDKHLKSLLSSLSCTLYGGNINEKFFVLTGTGGNGKGVIVKMLDTVIGNYFKTININQLTTYEKDGNRPNSELAACRWARCVMASEPETDGTNKLITANIKKWTGNDKMTARLNYQNAFIFEPKFTMIIQVNDIPQLSSVDGGVQRRMICQPFVNNFIKKVEGQELKENERIMDENLKTLLTNDHEYRNAFLYILIDEWISNKGIFYENETTKQCTAEYFELQNPVKDWFNEYYIKDTKNKIKAVDIYNHYKITQKDNDNMLTSTAFGKLLKLICESKKTGTGMVYNCSQKPL